jgi:multiple sugar transport system substrate-binding protein
MIVPRPDRRATLGLLAGAAAGLAGCDARGQGTRLTFWAMGNEATNVPQLLPRFEALNPGITVDVQALPWTAAHEKLLTAYAGGSLPDVSQIGNTWVSELTAIGALSPTPPAAADLLTDQFEAVLETNEVAGRAMTTPWYVDTRLLFYRTDLLARAGLDAPPRNWGEWKRAMHGIKRVAGGDNYAILLPLNEFEQLLTFGLQTEEPLLRDRNTRGNFSNPGFISALAFYRSLFAEGLAPLASAAQISNVWTEFARGYFSFYFSGPWSVGDFRSRLPASFQSSWATAGVPGPKVLGASAAGGSVAAATLAGSIAATAGGSTISPAASMRVACSASMICSRLDSAVTISTGVFLSCSSARIARSRSMPGMPGMFQSVITRSNLALRSSTSALLPSSASAVLKTSGLMFGASVLPSKSVSA